MTFKHIKFEDSPVMRSLERIAKEKGLVKPSEPLIKTATPKTDLTPTPSLLTNLLKLCTGLREKGFEKQANELEVYLVNYKKAESIYETSKEKGEDLVHAAHPDGSHELEDVDVIGDGAVFEDILDQMVKSLEVVNKKPTGKLSNAKAIDAAKKVVSASFLARKKDSKVALGQEIPATTHAPTTTTSNITEGLTEGVAGTAAFIGGVKGLKWLYSKLSRDPSIDRQVVFNIEKALGRKLTNAEADAITKQVVEKIGQKELQRILGSDVAKAVTEKVITQAIEKGVQSAGTEAMEQTITKSPSILSRIIGWFGKGGKATGVAGIGETTSEAAGAAGIGATASAAAIALSAVIGGYIGYELFERKFYATDLKDAGSNLLSEYQDIEKDANFSMHSSATAFKISLDKVLQKAAQASNLNNEPTIANLQSLQDYIDNLQDASNYAYQLLVQARETWNPSNLKPGESGQDHWYTGLKGLFSGFRDVEIAGANFVNVAQKGISDARTILNRILTDMQKKIEQQAGGSNSQQLLQKYDATLATIQRYKAQIDAKRPKNQAAIDRWLEQAVKEVSDEQRDFKNIDVKDREAAVKPYQDRLADITNKLDAFKSRFLM
jgi:hypothetical protein